jgi:hypothetical protein
MPKFPMCKIYPSLDLGNLYLSAKVLRSSHVQFRWNSANKKFYEMPNNSVRGQSSIKKADM